MKEPQVTPQQLTQVRKYIERGWCQWKLCNGNSLRTSTQWCIGGAILATLGNTMFIDEPAFAFSHALGFETWQEMVEWNNEQTHTQKQILLRIDQAIKGLTNVESPSQSRKKTPRDLPSR